MSLFRGCSPNGHSWPAQESPPNFLVMDASVTSVVLTALGEWCILGVLMVNTTPMGLLVSTDVSVPACPLSSASLPLSRLPVQLFAESTFPLHF